MGRRAVIIRADASVATGTGHVMRCLALAQELKDAGREVLFAAAECPVTLVGRLQAEAIPVRRIKAPPGSMRDAAETVRLAQQRQAAWIVVDGYIFSERYQDAIQRAGLRLLFVDDNGHCPRYAADLVLNQNVYADASFYPRRAAGVALLLGPRYALIRREFRGGGERRRRFPAKAAKLLVTLGGADPGNLTEKVVKALLALADQDVTAKVLIGGINPRQARLADRLAGGNLQFLTNVANMPELMGWADAAVTAAGSTTLETSFMRLPALMIVLADNQRRVAARMAELGAGVNLGWHAQVTIGQLQAQMARLIRSRTIRRSLAAACGKLVDGRGARRIMEEMSKRDGQT